MFDKNAGKRHTYKFIRCGVISFFEACCTGCSIKICIKMSYIHKNERFYAPCTQRLRKSSKGYQTLTISTISVILRYDQDWLLRPWCGNDLLWRDPLSKALIPGGINKRKHCTGSSAQWEKGRRLLCLQQSGRHSSPKECRMVIRCKTES